MANADVVNSASLEDAIASVSAQAVDQQVKLAVPSRLGMIRPSDVLAALNQRPNNPPQVPKQFFDGLMYSFARQCAANADARESEAEAERARIIAALEKLKPGEEPYSRGSWEMVRKAEMRLWERMMEAVKQ